MKLLEESLLAMNTSPEHTVLRLIIFHIFAIYYQCKNDPVSSSSFYMKALNECRDAGDTSLLVISMLQSKTGSALANQSLKVQVIWLVSETVKKFSTSDTQHIFGDLLLTILNDCESALTIRTIGSIFVAMWLVWYSHLIKTKTL